MSSFELFSNADKRDSWSRFWETLANMKGLQHLYIELILSQDWASVRQSDELKAFVQPIRAITIPATFDLVLPQFLRHSIWATLPCNVSWMSRAEYFQNA